MSTGCLHFEENLEDIPMSRYTNPIPTSCPKQIGLCQAQQEGIDHILTALACQNQILTDLLGAVNSLTATLLFTKS